MKHQGLLTFCKHQTEIKTNENFVPTDHLIICLIKFCTQTSNSLYIMPDYPSCIIHYPWCVTALPVVSQIQISASEINPRRQILSNLNLPALKAEILHSVGEQNDFYSRHSFFFFEIYWHGKRVYKLGKKEIGRAKESIEFHMVAKTALNLLILGRIQFNEWQMMQSDYLPDKIIPTNYF